MSQTETAQAKTARSWLYKRKNVSERKSSISRGEKTSSQHKNAHSQSLRLQNQNKNRTKIQIIQLFSSLYNTVYS
jgi:hypothetical protein